MKKYIVPILAGSLLLAACEDDLNQIPLSSATTETFYASTTDFTQGINAVYNDLLTYPDRQLNLSETRSDNLYAASPGGVRDWEGINDFQSTIASNVYVAEAWLTNYNGIYRANVLLDQLDKNGAVLTDALRTRFEAEAKFLRGFYYFDLVRWFGQVPIIDKPITSDESLTIPRSPVSDVYDLIISDLKFAVDNLPVSYDNANLGRATKYAAEGILALVYMTRSGATYDIDGPGLGLNEWNQAETLLNDIIASGNYSMLSNYSDIFSYSNENNKEVVFDVQYITGKTPVIGSTFCWVLVPDKYFQSKGKVAQGGLDIRPVSTDLLNAYESGDTRKDFSIQSGYVYNGVAESNPFFKKYVDVSQTPSNRLDWPINFIVLRYTDVLLLKAECVLHGASGSQGTDVDAVVNQVRHRAGLSPKSNITLTQLLDERRKEFAAEGTRWHDLVRFGVVNTVMTSWIATEDVSNVIEPFNNNYIIYPLPQSEMDVTPGLYTQNDGY